MKYLLLAILFFSCVTEKKAYRKVQEDQFVDSREKKILLDKTILLYPDLRDTAKIVHTHIDSAEYNATIAAYLDVINQLTINDTAEENYMIGDSIQVIYRVSKKDSLRIISTFLKNFHPPAIKQIITKETPTTDGRKLEHVRDMLNACEGMNAFLNNENDTIQKKLSKRNQKTGWWIASGLGLAIMSFFAGRVLKR